MRWTTRKYWLWVDGQKHYYDYPADPPGYTVEEVMLRYWQALLQCR